MQPTTLHVGVQVWEQCGLNGKVRLQGSWIGMVTDEAGGCNRRRLR